MVDTAHFCNAHLQVERARSLRASSGQGTAHAHKTVEQQVVVTLDLQAAIFMKAQSFTAQAVRGREAARTGSVNPGSDSLHSNSVANVFL